MESPVSRFAPSGPEFFQFDLQGGDLISERLQPFDGRHSHALKRARHALIEDRLELAQTQSFLRGLSDWGIAFEQAGPGAPTSWALPRTVGLRKALEIALLGQSLDTAEAIRLGLVSRVVPEADLESETRRLVESLATGPTRAFGRIRQLLREAFDNELGAHLDAEADGFLECADTADFSEGVEAFFHKRAPVFTGQ